ncbi:MAG: oxysterol-binding protein [Amphiamblys sp. WSBS2006]|nr:MAG: oxysterol-binding protein [Amphiamblys sp. WSBS2006]
MEDNKQSSRIGFLEKWTNYAGGYKKRWFVVNKSNIAYYKTASDTACKQMYPMGCSYVREEKSSDRGFTLVIRGETKTHILDLRAESKAERGEWVRFFRGLQEKEVSTLAAAAQRLEDVISALDSRHKKRGAIKKYLHKINIFEGKKKDEDVSEHMDIGDVLEAIHKTVLREASSDADLREMVAELQGRERVLLTKYKELWDEYAAVESEPAPALSYTKLCQCLYTESVADLREELSEVGIEETFYDIEEKKTDSGIIVREKRTALPAKSTEVPKASLFNIIKNAIGKDITRITLPINYSEPLSMLQRLCEDMEYSDLLDRANRESDSMRRLLLVGCFSVSPYASTASRLARPFNPLLGETFEYVDDERKFRYISEQTSHHPPIGACHCESDGYTYWCETSIDSGFNGKAVWVAPKGYCHVVLKDTGEHYAWKKVKTGVNNVIFGKMWIEHYGSIEIKNHTTGEHCVLTFLRSGSSKAPEYSRVEGVFSGAGGEAEYTVRGTWCGDLAATSVATGESFEVWRASERPARNKEYYNMPDFAMQLNQLLEEDAALVAPTDSRLRPDQRAMEEGKWALSGKLKEGLEHSQRRRQRAAEKEGRPHIPRWFTLEQDEDTGNPFWKYNGEYWPLRGQLPPSPIFKV